MQDEIEEKKDNPKAHYQRSKTQTTRSAGHYYYYYYS